MKKTTRTWLNAALWIFLAGAFLIGPLDLFHTCKDVQTYLIRRALTPQCNWPWYVPFQMGFAGVGMLVYWVIFKRQLSGRFKRRDTQFENDTRILIPVSIGMVFLAYALGFYLMESPWHLNYYLAFWIASVFYLALGHRKIYILAFCLIGVTGLLVESVFISPGAGINYFVYTQKDLLGNAPAWLLVVYGWVGVFIQEVSRELD